MYTIGQVHGLDTDSTIKKVLDKWYENNLLSEQEAIDINGGFCGDREPSTSQSTNNGQGGTGTTKTYYSPYFRAYGNNNPTFKCSNNNDLYTVKEANTGNKALTYPIGLISVDELTYAGLMGMGGNTGFYFYTNESYWTMSPYSYQDGIAGVFSFSADGRISYQNINVTNSYGIRPVINLKADIKFTGSGTISDPYVVVS